MTAIRQIFMIKLLTFLIGSQEIKKLGGFRQNFSEWADSSGFRKQTFNKKDLDIFILLGERYY